MMKQPCQGAPVKTEDSQELLRSTEKLMRQKVGPLESRI